jgi:hypothetical protein
MKDRVKEFADKHLISVEWPSQKIAEKELWNVSGILKDRTNQVFKFDVRPMIDVGNNEYGKKFHLNAKSDKIVFEYVNEYIIVETKELFDYMLNSKVKNVHLKEVIKELSWNIFIKKDK